MMPDSKLAAKLAGKDFIYTAEYLPEVATITPEKDNFIKSFGTIVTAVNAADNHYGVAMSSLAASIALGRAGIEPVFQIVTRDRNRIAIQSDLLGAAYLGIKNVLCLSGFHQTLIGEPESANVFDIDSVQLIGMVKKMNEGKLLTGKTIKGKFDMLIGAATNPCTRPLELNVIRLAKKVAAGADFIQTQAVFDITLFKQWFEAIRTEGLLNKTAIIAGVLPLKSSLQAKELSEAHTDYVIPDSIVKRLQAAGNEDNQKKEGLAIAAETIKSLKSITGLRGVHILSGGYEDAIFRIIEAAA
jgi:methylenetetrahydrofolate reductase (NADPH)